MPPTTTPPTLLESVYGMSEALERTFQLNRIQESKPFTEKQIAVVADLDEFESYVRRGQWIPVDSVVYRVGKEVCVVGRDDSYLVLCEETDRITQVRVLSDPATTTTLINDILNVFPNVPIRVRWIYNSKGDDVKLPIRTDNLPRDEFYPNLNGESLLSYYDRFMSSNSNILVLIGPPGTGKTSFIRGLLHHTRRSAVVSYDSEILKTDTIFTQFMSSNNCAFMVLEDADTFLSSRVKSGNTVMHKFLNVGDGLISTAGKKIVFSTNLPSVRDIDDALLRPGRCFDILRFDKLTPEQAKAIRPEYGGDENAITLAELLNTEKSPSSSSHSSVNHMWGFKQ